MSDKLNNWRPIETAPKDGTYVLIARNGRVTISRWYVHYFEGKPSTQREPEWEQDEMYGGMGGYQGPIHPTHWMPLPEAPK